MTPLISRRRIAGVAFCATLSISTSVHAQSRGVVFADVTGGQDRSATLGVGLALPGSSLGRGWAVRTSLSAGNYDYRGPATTIDGKYRGAEVFLLRQTSGPNGYFNVGGGSRYVDTRLSPVDPGSKREGTRWDVGVALDGARSQGPWRVQGYGSYGVRMRDYYVRADVTRRVGASAFRVGVEVGAEGDRDYERQRVGLVTSVTPKPNWQLRLALGARNGGESRGGYGALSAVRTF